MKQIAGNGNIIAEKLSLKGFKIGLGASMSYIVFNLNAFTQFNSKSNILYFSKGHQNLKLDLLEKKRFFWLLSFGK